MNVYLCGMIGSGKTTIGKRLAESLGLDFFDLDAEMDSRLGHSFHELVRDRGWLVFRELEYDICRSFASRTQAIIGLGGGTVRYAWNLDVLRPSGRIVLLEAEIGTLVDRVRAADRPRVNAGTTLEEDVRLLWEREGHKYYRAADFIYRSDEKSVDEEVGDLRNLLTGDPLFAGLEANRFYRKFET